MMKNTKIPDFPRLRLRNYTLSLPDNIKINTPSKIIISCFNKEIISVLSKKMNLEESTIKKYMRQQKYPISILAELTLLKKGIFQEIETETTIFLSKWKKIKLPTHITPKLTYILGYLQGDGSIETNNKRINFADEYIEQLVRVNNLIKMLFGIEGIILECESKLSKKHFYVLEIGSKVLNYYFSEYFKINKGIKANLTIPKIVYYKKELLKWYIIGLFDADGTLPKCPDTCKQLFVDITFKDKSFIEEIRNALKSFDIFTLDPYCRIKKSPSSEFISETWELRIRKKSQIISFLRNIGFSHPDKFKRQQKLLNLMQS